MEALIAAASARPDQGLPPGLDFGLTSGSHFVASKRLVSIPPVTGNDYSPQGLTQCTIKLPSSGWLTPDSLKISMVVNNRHATRPLQPVSIYGGSVLPG